MSKLRPIVTGTAAAGVLTALVRRRRGADPVHAPGHRHRKRPPREEPLQKLDTEPHRNQPWIRRSHSDSQKRRFRR